MDSNKMATPAEVAKENTATSDACDSTSGDKLTILETIGPMLTKHYKADGSVEPYDDAASFRVKEIEVNGIDNLHDLLTDLETMSKNCIIRGKFVGKDKAVAANKPGTYARTNQNFIDQPLHAIMIDIDKYKPAFGDPVEDAEICILGFIERILPKAFHGATFHWQMSSSAGKKGSENILKAHVWFWLEKPYKCSELTAWGKLIGPMIDSVPFRRAQIHYTANPVFDEGVPDPVAIRSGLFRGTHDTVPLVISEDTLATARETGSGQGGSDMKVVDPSEKDGIIGAFHKAFSAEQVLTDLLDGFEQVTQRRWTWLDGGGTPEGVWVHDDDMHVGSSHNTWPFGSSLVNLWDLVREFKFGNLDASDDDFEQLNIDALPIQAKPSHLAMCAFVEGLDEVQAVIREERTAELRHWTERINAAADYYTLEQIVAPKIQAADVSMMEREALVNALQARARAIGNQISKDIARRLLTPPRRTLAADAPRWIEDWVWVSSLDKFMHIRTKQSISLLSFNAQFDREMTPDADGIVPKAADMALRVWGVPVVAEADYYPLTMAADQPFDPFFERDGVQVINTYRPDLLPEMPDHYSPMDKIAIEVIKTHLELLIPDETDRNLFLDFLAHNVQFPGKKIRWAPLLIGMEGDGKTAVLTLMAAIMGSKNYRILNNKTLSSDFTGWASGQCLVGVEEVKLHNSDRFDIFNALKPIISNTEIEVHGKGKDPVTKPNFSNLILLTNHHDALPVTDNDRRIFFLRSPFNNKAELYAAVEARTGMPANEFHDQLFDVAIGKHAGALRKWFMKREFKNPDFKPDSRAPENDTRRESIELSRSEEEIAIMGVIESGCLGVYPNFLAGGLLTEAVANKYGIKVSPTRFNSALSNLGWKPFVEKPSKKDPSKLENDARNWHGKSYRWYYRGEKSELTAAKLADKLEAERKSKELEGDFAD